MRRPSRQGIIVGMRPGTLFADRFEVERRAGAGGMGSVYRVRDRTDGQVVALKVMHAGGEEGSRAAERFLREARAIADLRHAGIVRYVAHGQVSSGAASGERWLAMEWVEGESLRERLRERPLGVRESVALATRVAEALGAVHARGVVHRDVKPTNLLLPGGDMERAKLVDFGVARMRSPGVEDVTRTGTRVGTPGYMAPEQARGDKEVDARADVFALGCVLFECLTGRPPFVGVHEMAVLAKILLEDAPRASELREGLPRPLVDLVARMLSKAPELRPKDGFAVAADLAGLGEMQTADDSVSVERAPGLTGEERRLLSVVMAGNLGEGWDGDSEHPTRADARPTRTRLDTLAERARTHGARFERLAGGAVLAALAGTGAATDQAARAARLALAMRAVAPEAPMSLATGRAEVTRSRLVGEVIDRAARLLGAAAQRSAALLRVDEVTAGLLDARFDVGGDDSGLSIRGEHEVVEAARTVLGRQTPFVGREPEMGLLASVYAIAVAEPVARLLLVTGAAGIGKSRLRQELLRRLRAGADAPEVWFARGDPLGAGSPFGLLAQAIRGAAGVREGEPLPVRRRKLRARVGRNVPAEDVQRIAEFLGEIAAIPFLEERSVQLRAARRDPKLLAEQTRRAWEDFARAETAVRPVVLVLENLQWGDQPTVRLIDSAVRALRDRPLLVLAIARPDVHETFPRLWTERGLQEIRLAELTPRACERIVKDVLGERANADATSRLIERSLGNPLFLEELIRASGAGQGDAVPGSVLAMVQARLEGLPDEVRRVLRAASVFGQVFWQGGVATLLGGTEETREIHQWLTDLVDREVVVRSGERKFSGEQEFAFRHQVVREAAYAMLTEADRGLGHRLAGEWLERAGETDATTLAEHFERGGDAVRASSFWLRAAEQALGGSDAEAALRWAERGEGAAPREVRGALRRIQAEARLWRGENALAERCGMEAMELLPVGSAPWLGAVGQVAVAASSLSHGEVIQTVFQALERVGLSDDPEGPALAAWGRLATAFLAMGVYDKAVDVVARIERSIDRARETNPAVAGRIRQAQAFLALVGGDRAASLELFEASSAEFDRAGDLHGACSQRMNAGYASLVLGANDRAEKALSEVLAISQRMGFTSLVEITKHNLAVVLARRGELAQARAMEAEAVETLRAQGNRRQEVAARIYLSAICLLAGDAEEAVREAKRALERDSPPPIRAYAVATLARALAGAGLAAEALAVAREAADLLASLGRLEEGEPTVRLALAEALHASGDLPAAKLAIADAQAHLLAAASKIKDEELRRSFLDAVPENARTIRLAKEWAG